VRRVKLVLTIMNYKKLLLTIMNCKNLVLTIMNYKNLVLTITDHHESKTDQREFFSLGTDHLEL
jgi:hypothetical protein